MRLIIAQQHVHDTLAWLNPTPTNQFWYVKLDKTLKETFISLFSRWRQQLIHYYCIWYSQEQRNRSYELLPDIQSSISFSLQFLINGFHEVLISVG